MTPVLQLFKMESTSDRCYKQCTEIRYLVAVKETVGNIHKWLSNVYGNAAVHSSNISHWAKMEK
jgi:hypothetical protein